MFLKMFLALFATMVVIVVTVGIVNYAPLGGDITDPAREAVLLEIATVISEMEHDFLFYMMGPLALRHVPAGETVQLLVPEDVKSVLLRFSRSDWAALFYHLSGDELEHITQLFEALQH
jgi:hypothetical protein